jgi:DoxX-like family
MRSQAEDIVLSVWAGKFPSQPGTHSGLNQGRADSDEFERRLNVSDSSTSGTRRTAGSILIFLGGLVLIVSAGAKFAQVPAVVSQLAAVGFAGSKLIIIAALEVFSALLILIPRTRSIGLLMISAYLGGAIATHMGHSEPVYQPAFVLTLFWVGAWLRHREVLWSLKHGASEASLAGESNATTSRSPANLT